MMRLNFLCCLTLAASVRIANGAGNDTFTPAELQAFASMEPVDTHAHAFKVDPAFYAMLERFHLHLVNIVTSNRYDSDFPALGLKIKAAQQFVAKSGGHAVLCTTFDPFRFSDADFAEAAIRQLNSDFAQGAVAVKIWKNIGMELKDASGRFVMPDDPRFAPVYKDIAAHGKTLIAHVADPDSCWQPPNKNSPDYQYFTQHPEWYMFTKPDHPAKATIIEARDRMLQQNPTLRVVGAHLGSLETNLDEIGRRLDRYPNFSVDLAARVIYLTREPREKVREFLIKYQDRVLYGTDLALSDRQETEKATASWEKQYATDWKFFSSNEPLEYRGKTVEGLGLPKQVLRKIYHDNAVRWIPGVTAPLPAEEPHRAYPESATVSRFGIVATSQTLASRAGAAVLERGGSAVDAAIAANAALGVIEPMMNGIGGDLFAIVYEAKTGKLFGLNASGNAPKGLSIEFLHAHDITGKIPAHSVHAVTVPGAVAGWGALRDRFGKLSLGDDLAPAIFMAEQGIPVTEMDAQAWAKYGPPLANMPGFASTFLPDGKAPQTGQVFANIDLSQTLRQIATEGVNAFYRGSLAARTVDFLQSQGSTMTRSDFADSAPEWVDPVSTTYRGWTVWELPPNGQGVAALEMLNIMERFPLGEYGKDSVQALHVMIEAKKLAYADLARYVGDPKFSKIATAELVSKALAEKRAQLIGPTAKCEILPCDLTSEMTGFGNDTTYLAAIDRDGNIVSLIQSNAGAFGTGLVAPKTGFVLQNRGTGFTLEPDHPNSLAPAKRPLHTIIPALMKKGGKTIGFGIMGGFNQPQAHAQFVSNIADFGMNIQAALDAPRFTKSTFNGCDVLLESRIPDPARAKLTDQGHEVQTGDAFSQSMGRGNAVMLDERGIKYGASDPRADGQAVPESPNYWGR